MEEVLGVASHQFQVQEIINNKGVMQEQCLSVRIITRKRVVKWWTARKRKHSILKNKVFV